MGVVNHVCRAEEHCLLGIMFMDAGKLPPMSFMTFSHMFLDLSCMRLSQLNSNTVKSCQMGYKNAHRSTQAEVKETVMYG
jgi:hypothetical protein